MKHHGENMMSEATIRSRGNRVYPNTPDQAEHQAAGEADAKPQQQWMLRERTMRALVMARPQLTGAELRVMLIALAHASRVQFMQHGHLEFWCGHDKLIKLSGHNDRTIRRTIETMLNRGIVGMWQQGGGGRADPHHLIFNFDWILATESALGADLIAAWPGAKALGAEGGSGDPGRRVRRPANGSVRGVRRPPNPSKRDSYEDPIAAYAAGEDRTSFYSQEDVSDPVQSNIPEPISDPAAAPRRAQHRNGRDLNFEMAEAAAAAAFRGRRP